MADEVGAFVVSTAAAVFDHRQVFDRQRLCVACAADLLQDKAFCLDGPKAQCLAIAVDRQIGIDRRQRVSCSTPRVRDILLERDRIRAKRAAIRRIDRVHKAVPVGHVPCRKRLEAPIAFRCIGHCRIIAYGRATVGGACLAIAF